MPYKTSQQSGCWASLCQAALVPFSHPEQGWGMLSRQVWSNPPCSHSLLQPGYAWEFGKKRSIPEGRAGLLTIFTLFGGHILAFKAWQSTQEP